MSPRREDFSDQQKLEIVYNSLSRAGSAHLVDKTPIDPDEMRFAQDMLNDVDALDGYNPRKLLRAIRSLPKEHAAPFITLIKNRGVIDSRVIDEVMAQGAVRQELLNSELRDAVAADNLTEVERLLAAGAKPNDPDHNKPALHFAAANGNRRMVELLLEHEAAVDAKDQAGRGALHMAALGGHENCADALLDARADVNLPDDAGYTALHLAVDSGFLSVAHFLLKRGADIDARNHEGETALHMAVKHENYDMLKLLLNQNADPNYPDHDGKTPGDLVKSGRMDAEEAQKYYDALIAKGAFIEGQRSPTSEELEKLPNKQKDSYRRARYSNGDMAENLRDGRDSSSGRAR